jgi:hypothetical protein
MQPKCLFGKSAGEWLMPDVDLNAPVVINTPAPVFAQPGPNAPKPIFTQLPARPAAQGPKCPGAPRPRRTIHRYRFAPYGSPV